VIDTFWESSFDGFKNHGEIFTHDVPRLNKGFYHNAILTHSQLLEGLKWEFK
jgi:hypothetical protein